VWAERLARSKWDPNLHAREIASCPPKRIEGKNHGEYDQLEVTNCDLKLRAHRARDSPDPRTQGDA